MPDSGAEPVDGTLDAAALLRRGPAVAARFTKPRSDGTKTWSIRITADEVFELMLALSWGIDRFDDEAQARRRVTMATTGIFASPPRTAMPDLTPTPAEHAAEAS